MENPRNEKFRKEYRMAVESILFRTEGGPSPRIGRDLGIRLAESIRLAEFLPDTKKKESEFVRDMELDPDAKEKGAEFLRAIHWAEKILTQFAVLAAISAGTLDAEFPEGEEPKFSLK